MKVVEPHTHSLSAKIAAKRGGRLATTPRSARGHFVAAWSGKCSRRRAIKTQCLDCLGFGRQAIADNTGWACPPLALPPLSEAVKSARRFAKASGSTRRKVQAAVQRGWRLGLKVSDVLKRRTRQDGAR